MRAYAPFILKCFLDIFWNFKKFGTKNSHAYLQVLRANKVFHEKIDLSCGVCKKDKFGAKNKAFHKIKLLFLI
jgi:hypothetical protein